MLTAEEEECRWPAAAPGQPQPAGVAPPPHPLVPGPWARPLDSWRSPLGRRPLAALLGCRSRPPSPDPAGRCPELLGRRRPPGIGLERKDPEDWRSAGFGQARLCRI